MPRDTDQPCIVHYNLAKKPRVLGVEVYKDRKIFLYPRRQQHNPVVLRNGEDDKTWFSNPFTGEE